MGIADSAANQMANSHFVIVAVAVTVTGNTSLAEESIRVIAAIATAAVKTTMVDF